MPLSINEFKTQIKENLPTSFYEVNISPPVGGGEQLKIRTESVALPGISFLSVDNFSPFGNGKIYNVPYRYNPQEVSMSHFIDDKADLYKLFRDWSNLIVDLDGVNKYGAKYMLNGGYAVDASVTAYNRRQDKAKTIKFYELFPINVDQVQLSWGQYDEVAKLNVSYRFTSFTVE